MGFKGKIEHEWQLMRDMTDSHLFRVLRYTRYSDWLQASGMAALPPGLMWLMERVAPSHVSKGGFAPIMRLNIGVGLIGGFILAYTKSACTSGDLGSGSVMHGARRKIQTISLRSDGD